MKYHDNTIIGIGNSTDNLIFKLCYWHTLSIRTQDNIIEINKW